MMRKQYLLVFSLVIAWKIALFVFTAQPIPANDSFFYDGGVVHYLLHGGYYNASLAEAYPISGRELFSTYPPGYQLALFLWMSVFGTSALAVMGLQLAFFIIYAGALLLIFQRLKIPAWCANVAGFFLLSLTFHDRMDGCAHAFGMLAVYSCVRTLKLLGRQPGESSTLWAWLMAPLIVFALATSLQIGVVYLSIIGISTLMACYFGKERPVVLPFVAIAIIPVLLIVLVKVKLPLGWAGFQEASQMARYSFLEGLHKPTLQDMLKVLRTVPGVFLITAFLFISWFKQHYDFESDAGRREEVILLATLLPALGIVVASLTFVSPNTVAISNYLQPLAVASYLALAVSLRVSQQWIRSQIILLIPAILLCSVRSIGMTTWGVLCASDYSYADSVRRVESELAPEPSGSKVVLSAAYLYGAAKHTDIEMIHSDWMAPAGGDNASSDTKAMLTLKPTKIIVTQFDYFRRYREALSRVTGNPSLKEIKVENTAHVRAPDSYDALQKVVQNISWAPVIITLTWQNAP